MTVGETFVVNTVEEVLVHIKDFGMKHNFKVSQLRGTKFKAKGQIVRNPVVLLGCSRSGYSEKNRDLLQGMKSKPSSFEPASNSQSENNNANPSQLLKPVATRKSSSFKCGCGWKLGFSFSHLYHGYQCKVICASLEHNN